MTRTYRLGSRTLVVSAEPLSDASPLTVKIMDIWIDPVVRREERNGRAETITAEEMTACLAFIGNGGRHGLASVSIYEPTEQS